MPWFPALKAANALRKSVRIYFDQWYRDYHAFSSAEDRRYRAAELQSNRILFRF